jgi:hypothetical protein
MPSKRYAPVFAAVVNAATGPLVASVGADGPGQQGRRVRQAFLALLSIDVDGFLVIGDARTELAHWAAERVANLQTVLRRLIEKLVELQESEAGGLLPEVGVTALSIAPTVVDSYVLLTIDGPAGDVFLYLFMLLLRDLGVHQIRRCAASDCGRAFAKVSRAEYCSSRCQKRIYMREYNSSSSSGKDRHGKTRKK